MLDPRIEALSDEYRVAAYNLRARTERAYDLYDLVEDCRATIDGPGMDKPVVAGVSMGGFVAIRLAIEYPDDISGIVLVASLRDFPADVY
ncbi:MAG: pimeloyl-ACP methyl ester carboxylesterase [Natronomonas sp.]|jgi:pimeloyl-ACP methyl ester carboxylesterase